MRLLWFSAWRRLVLAAKGGWNALDVPLRSPILTTRQLMALTAVVAIHVGIALAIPRAAACREKAETQAPLELYFRESARHRLAEARDAQTALDQFRRVASGAEQATEEYLNSRLKFEVVVAKYLKEMADYHANLKATNHRGSWFPWGSVPNLLLNHADKPKNASQGDAFGLPSLAIRLAASRPSVVSGASLAISR